MRKLESPKSVRQRIMIQNNKKKTYSFKLKKPFYLSTGIDEDDIIKEIWEL